MKQVYVLCITYVVLVFSLSIIMTKYVCGNLKSDAQAVDTSITNIHLESLRPLLDAQMIEPLSLSSNKIQDLSDLRNLEQLTPVELQTLKGL